MLFLLLVTLLFEIAEATAQDLATSKDEPITLRQEIKNEQGQSYTLFVTLPVGYVPERQYKVLYYLDAWWLKEMVIGSYRIKALSSKMEEVILVGISSVGSEKDWHQQRNKDFTPSAYSIEKMKVSMNGGGIDLNESTTGGAEEFMQFFKGQIITSIESKYKVDAASRGILGHSFGGLWGFYSFVKHPDVFANYILLSPAVWWNQSELFSGKSLTGSSNKVNMFMVMGTVEFRILKESILELTEILKSGHSEKVALKFKEYENATHNSVLPQGIYDGIEMMYTTPR